MKRGLVQLLIVTWLSAAACGDDPAAREGLSCDAPDVVEASAVDIPSGVLVPKLEHSLVLRLMSEQAVRDFDDRMSARLLQDREFAGLFVGAAQLSAGEYVLFEYESSSKLWENMCDVLDAVDATQVADSVFVVDEP